MQPQNLIKLKEVVNKKSKGFKNPIELFASLRQTMKFSRLELMIIDSTIKGMPLDSLHNTLLLTETSYDRIVLEIIDKLTTKIRTISN